MATLEININMDKQKCNQCGKIGTGHYEASNIAGKHICQKCVMDNIKRTNQGIADSKNRIG